jgi:hypothetical protein
MERNITIICKFTFIQRSTHVTLVRARMVARAIITEMELTDVTVLVAMMEMTVKMVRGTYTR